MQDVRAIQDFTTIIIIVIIKVRRYTIILDVTGNIWAEKAWTGSSRTMVRTNETTRVIDYL